MLKTTESPDRPAPSKNNSSKSASSRNNNSKPISEKNNNNNEVNEFDVDGNNVKHAKKLGKLSKSRKLKSKKISKSQNLAKSGKKLWKSGNSTNFNVTENKSKFLTFDVRIAFHRLWLAFTEALILWHFNLKYYICIEIDILGYAIVEILSQLTSGTNPNKVVIKIDLSQWRLVTFFLRKIIFAKT